MLSLWALFPAELDANGLSHDSAFNAVNDPLIKASGSLKGISDMLGKDGYHELCNEPDGVKEKLTEVLGWIEEHVLQGPERAKT
uniref:Uncharacterized protein n=1 Tax=Moniliophthora roreri TaxID=221103 RepID=A0A0W0FSP7_MONRR